MGTALRGALEGLDHLSRWAVVVCMATMTSVVSAQVFLRYGFSGSIDWAEEISRLSFVWAVFMAIPHGVKFGAHVGIDVLAKRFPPAAAHLLERVLKLASGALLAIVAVQAGLAARDNWDQLMPTVDLSSGWFYLAVTVGCAHSALHLLAQVLAARGERRPAMHARTGEAQ
jgi:TRAP-type C4-dicarboxylate transport system permease small subunit